MESQCSRSQTGGLNSETPSKAPSVEHSKYAICYLNFQHGFPDGSDGKEPTCDAGDPDSVLGSGGHLEKGTLPAPALLPEGRLDRGAG